MKVRSKKLKITDREVSDLREDLSRVKRQIDLFKNRNTHLDGKCRLALAKEIILKIDSKLCEI